MQQKTTITLITGALRSGKTALLKRRLKTSNRRLGVPMNEFMEVASDCEF
jgi:G3E family GTPase